MPEITNEQRKALEEKIKKMSPEELREFQKQQCIFCQIIAGKVPSKIVYSDDQCLAVLDINPASKGHLLIMPKEHYAIMPQIPDEIISHLFLVSKYLSQILLKALKASGTNVFVANGIAAGQRAQHFLLHLIPRKDGDGLLKVEDKLIGKDVQKKVRMLIENKLNESLGVKKTVVEAKEQKKIEEFKAPAKVEWKEEEPKVVEAEFEETKEKPEEKPENEPKAKKPKLKKEAKKKQKQPEKSEKTAEEEPNQETEPEETSADVSLDDIANLFK